MSRYIFIYNQTQQQFTLATVTKSKTYSVGTLKLDRVQDVLNILDREDDTFQYEWVPFTDGNRIIRTPNTAPISALKAIELRPRAHRAPVVMMNFDHQPAFVCANLRCDTFNPTFTFNQ